MALWCLKALVSALIVFFFTYGGIQSNILGVNGYNPDVWFTGSLMYLCVLLVRSSDL